MRTRLLTACVLVAVIVALAGPVLATCLGCESGMQKMTCANSDESHAAYTRACCCGMRGLPKASAMPEATFPVSFQVAGLEITPIVLNAFATVKTQLNPIFLRYVGASQFSSPKHSISILKQSFLI